MRVARRYRADLSRYMAECDANYIRLLKLIPQLESIAGDLYTTGLPSTGAGHEGEGLASWRFSLTGSAAPRLPITVRVSVVEVFRYTATLEFSTASGFDGWLKGPVIGVRVYHDAATAEVISYQGQRGFRLSYETPNEQMYHQDEKNQINELFGEWLNLCLSAGGSLEVSEMLQAV